MYSKPRLICFSISLLNFNHQPLLSIRKIENKLTGLKLWTREGLSRQTGPSMLFENIFGIKNAGGGNFERHRDLLGNQNAFGPLGVICGGFGNDELEVLGETLENIRVVPGGIPVKPIPVVVIGKSDLGKPLKDLLNAMEYRDSEIPDDPIETGNPVVFLSGFSPLQVTATVRAILSSGIRGGLNVSPPMCAVAVPKAMDKPMAQLLEELQADHDLPRSSGLPLSP